MKKALLLYALCCSMFAAMNACAQGWTWAEGTRGNGNYGHFCCTDPVGNIYAAGETFNACNFTTDTIHNVGYTRIYLVKYDSLGNLKWTNGSLGRNSSGNIGCIGITSDLCGNVYMLGGYDSVISFDNHTLINPYVASYPAFSYKAYFFLAKFDASGNNLWIKSFGNFPLGTNYGSNCITNDIQGNVYVACSYFKNAILGGFPFLNRDTSGSTTDMLVSKIDSSGNVLWAKSYGGDSYDLTSNIAVTSSDGIYLTGTYYDSALVMGQDILTDTGAYGSTFIAKLDALGNPLWTRSTTGANDRLYTTGLAVNSNSEAFIAGWYTYKGLKLGPYVLPDAYYRHSYIAKYDPLGNILWIKELLGYSPTTEGITLDACGNIWALGHMGYDNVTANDTFDGHIILPPPDNAYPLFIAGWTSAGTFIDAAVLQSGGRSSYEISMTSDQSGHLYIIGNNNVDTLIISNDTLFGIPSTTNMFLAKYDPNLGCHSSLPSGCHPSYQNNVSLKPRELRLYPNPATETISIISSSTITSLTISNIIGQIKYSHEHSSQQVQIDVSDLPAGIYLMKINGTEIRKFVKQ